MMNAFVELSTPRCILRRLEINDVPVLKEVFDDPLTQRFLPELNELCSSEEGIVRMLDSFDIYTLSDEGFLWGITIGDVLAGFIAVMDLTDNPTVFYAVHPSFRSRGYMKECVRELILYLCETGRCSFVQTDVYEGNVASISLLMSSGFVVTDKIDNKIILKYEMSSLRRRTSGHRQLLSKVRQEAF